MQAQKKKVGVVSLGCDKNRVDTEKMLAIISERHEIIKDPTQADVIIVNTCAFLESARREAIEEILLASQCKRSGCKIIVTGCLPQKFIDEIYGELSEVDGFLGISDYASINEIIDRVLSGERVNAVGKPRGECGINRVLTTDGYAYLKIADGCSNHCTYCLIPKIRGAYRSVPQDALVKEAALLGNVGELILVAQDSARYGQDLSPKTDLAALIRSLSALENVRGIRLLYCYPENITEELIHEMECNPKVIRYLDIPFQHADDRVLKLMNRKGSGAEYLALIKKLRERVSGIALRSTFMAGFPGESEQEFENLVEFLSAARLDSAGFFAYSREKDTAADRLDGHLPERVKNARLKKLYSAQKKVAKEVGKSRVGKTYSVLAEGFDQGALVYYGRAYFQAPDIDGKVYFFSSEPVEYGKNYTVKINKYDDYDLYGERV